MKLSVSLLFLSVALVGMSCKKAKQSYVIKGDYVIVGHVGGFAGPAASAPFYLINNGQVRKDASHNSGNVPADKSGFNFNTVLPAAAYAQVADLQASIPSELLAQNNADIGTAMPDAGAIDIRTTINGVNYRWSFEQDISKTSAAVQAFVGKAGVVFGY